MPVALHQLLQSTGAFGTSAPAPPTLKSCSCLLWAKMLNSTVVMRLLPCPGDGSQGKQSTPPQVRTSFMMTQLYLDATLSFSWEIFGSKVQSLLETQQSVAMLLFAGKAPWGPLCLPLWGVHVARLRHRQDPSCLNELSTEAAHGHCRVPRPEEGPVQRCHQDAPSRSRAASQHPEGGRDAGGNVGLALGPTPDLQVIFFIHT